MKAFVILLVGLGLIFLILLVFGVLILLPAFLMDTDPAFHEQVPATTLSLVRMG